MENTTEIFDIEDAYINCGPSSDESKLITFLEERGLSSSYPYLKKSQVTFESLEYLTEDDIKEVITPVAKHAWGPHGAYLKRNQEGALELLNMIHNTSPILTLGHHYKLRRSHEPTSHNFELPVLFNTGMLDFNKNNALLFGGRCVITVDRISPIKVSRRFIKPQFSRDGHFRPNPENIVRKLFRAQDLSNILLLITPTAAARRQSDEHVMHGYEVDTQLHLGVTVLTTREREVIEREHNPHNYFLIFSSSYIELEDAFMKTPIRDQVFHVLRQKPLNAVCAWNCDCRIILHYRLCDEERRNMEIIRNTIPKLEDLTITASSIPSQIGIPTPQSVESTSELNMLKSMRQSGGEEKSASSFQLQPESPDPKPKAKKVKQHKRKSAKGLSVKARDSPLEISAQGTRRKINKKKKLPAGNIVEFKLPNFGEDGDKRYENPDQKQKKRKRKRKNKVYLIPNGMMDAAQRKALWEQRYKERLLQRERKWNRFFNSNTKRRIILKSKRP
ncbi:hypothetical protein ACLKA7_011662 [Drosophila subpalustris]